MRDDLLLEQLVSAPPRPHPYSRLPRLRDVQHLERSALLACPPTEKQYRGHIGYRLDIGSATFVAFTTYGRVDGDRCGQILFSRSLDRAIEHVNQTLDAKRRKGYRRIDSGQERITRATVEARIAELLAT